MASFTLLQKVQSEFNNLKEEVFASRIKGAEHIDGAVVESRKFMSGNFSSAFIENETTGELFTSTGISCTQHDFESAPFEHIG